MAKPAKDVRSVWVKKLADQTKPHKLSNRKGTIRGGFWKAVSAVAASGWTDEGLRAHLDKFDWGDEEPLCVYCGQPAGTWDHLYSPASGDETSGPSGFGSLLSNLVPACAKCNDSKSSEIWKDWLEGKARNAVRAQKFPGYAERLQKLELLAQDAKRDQFDTEELTSAPTWKDYVSLLERIQSLLDEADSMASELRQIGVRASRVRTK